LSFLSSPGANARRTGSVMGSYCVKSLLAWPPSLMCHVLYFGDGDEASQVAEFHSLTSIPAQHGEPSDKVFRAQNGRH
jgi:hypothetical protein